MEELKAGRDLDIQVAEKVMGWEWRRSEATGRRCLIAPDKIPAGWFTQRADGTEPLVGDWDLIHIPEYSTDITRAWEVAERLQSLGFDTEILREGVNATHVCLWKGAACVVSEGTSDTPATPALAICLAALRAVGASEQARTAR